jgi:thymidylate synthase (FAD)
LIQLIDYTEKPLTKMGECAAKCWNSKPSPKIGIECIENNHGRIMEFADVTIEISQYSSRVLREIYTHIVGTSRVQESTRYVDCKDFNYYIPESISNNPELLYMYENLMSDISDIYDYFIKRGIKKEDVANILPLGMHSKMILKINVRALLHMAEVRMCNRAYKEYRDFMKELIEILSNINDEWKTIISYMKPKCEILGYCNEKFSCGKYPKKEE